MKSKKKGVASKILRNAIEKGNIEKDDEGKFKKKKLTKDGYSDEALERARKGIFGGH
jgi:hypothetical protein